MSTDTSSYIPIDEDRLKVFSEQANHLLAKVKWSPKHTVTDRNRDQPEKDTGKWRDSSIISSVQEELSIIKIAKIISKDPVLLNESINHVLIVFRQSLRIGMHVSALYAKFSGLETLMALNAKGGLSESQKTEFREKYETASAITVFTAAYYIIWELSSFRTEEVSSINMDFAGIPEMNLTAPIRALDCMVYYYAAYLDKSGDVNTDAEFIKMTLVYFQGIVNEIKNREGSLKHHEPFSDKSYKLTGSDFCLNGFEVLTGDRTASVEFNRVELAQIVGNRDAKHKARRLAERLLCYDKERKQNPMHELGGFPTVRMGHGEPGTGKSLQIAATATMLHDYCKVVGIPFLFWPMPDNLISTFQGGSGERAMEWMKPLRDPSKIVYASVDDAENNLEDRTRQGVSAGVREVVGVFLRNTEGAYAVNHGNSVIELFTNIPEQLDKAVLSRIKDRFYIGGAMTKEDFIDQDYIWWKRFQDISPEFINMEDPKDYKYLSSQQLAKNISQTYQSLEKPSEERICIIFEKVSKKFNPKSHEFFAAFFHAVKLDYPFFTSRDVRNIQSAVTERIMDFDFEPSWLDDPAQFLLKDYDSKKNMIIELMKTNMKGLSFAEIRVQESIRYLDSLSKIVFAEDERKLDDMVSQLILQEKAARKASKLIQPK